MKDQGSKWSRLRYTATGALAALAAVGAIAGGAALANSSASKTPTPGARGNDANNPFVIVVRRLVNDGTITSTEGGVLDREILAGRVDTQTLAASGFTPSQLQAVQQALANTKRALAGQVARGTGG